MKAAGAVADRAAKGIEDRFNKLNPGFGTSALTGALKGLGAAVAAVGIEKIARGFLEANREIASFGQTARLAGIEVQKFQALRYAAGSQGIDGKTFDSGLTGLSKALNEAKSGEGDLAALLDANNIKLRDRTGQVISTNEALGVAADLISRASTEADKIKIADKFGIPADFVPLLENGAAALDQLAKNARDAGAVLSDDVIAKSKAFDEAWNGAWNSFITAAKVATVSAAQGLGDLISQAGEFQRRMTNAREAGSALGRQIGAMVGGEGNGPLVVTVKPNRTVSAPLPPSRPGRGYIGTDATRLPTKASGGSGSGGKSEEETRRDQVDSYIKSLERVNRVLEAEQATLGKSKAERAAAIELARIGTVTDEGQKQKITEIVQANEALRAAIDRVKKAQKDSNEAARFFGDAVTDGLEDLILNGEKATDVMRGLVKALARAALQAAIMGSGPLAGIFGTSGTNGAPGGLFGLAAGLFKGFDTGGYTGAGGKNEPKGVVHGGEYVFSKKAVQKIGLGNLEAMHRGFASGGFVGAMSAPSVPAGIGRGGGGPAKVIINNTQSDNVQATAQQQSNGDISVIIAAVEGRIADNMLRGRGPMSAATQAIQTNKRFR